MDQRNRRRFLIACALLASTAVSAQQSKGIRRIGFLSLDTADSGLGQETRKSFPQALEKFGWRQGVNIEIQWRWANGKVQSLDSLAADLVHNSVDLIVARNTAPIQAAMRATKSIPIVMLNGNFPVEYGLVASLARPGGNVTGTAYISLETNGKLLQILTEVAPHARRIVIPLGVAGISGRTESGQPARRALDDAATRLGVQLEYCEVSSPEQITAALECVANSQAQGVLWPGQPVLRERAADLVAISTTTKKAFVSGVPGVARLGGLVDYSPDSGEYLEQTARYVDRILKGARPADLPVHLPTRYRLSVNLQTAQTIGIKVPESVRIRADSVFEK
jgi:ABC-type uncharacterized transport system substrate-binding protein